MCVIERGAATAAFGKEKLCHVTHPSSRYAHHFGPVRKPIKMASTKLVATACVLLVGSARGFAPPAHVAARALRTTPAVAVRMQQLQPMYTEKSVTRRGTWTAPHVHAAVRVQRAQNPT